MPSSHLILWCPLLLPSIFPSIRDFSKELAVPIRWPKHWSFSLPTLNIPRVLREVLSDVVAFKQNLKKVRMRVISKSGGGSLQVKQQLETMPWSRLWLGSWRNLEQWQKNSKWRQRQKIGGVEFGYKLYTLVQWVLDEMGSYKVFE